MSSTFSREPGAVSSLTDSSDSDQLATSKSTPTAKRSSRRGLPTPFLILPQSGETFGYFFPEEWQEAIAAWLTYAAVAFLASPSLSQESAREVTTTETSGLSSPKWCGRFDPDTYSLRTCQDSLPGMEDATSERSSVTWPRSGLISDGVCWELTMSAPHTGESGCGYWRTPNLMDSLSPKSNEALAHEYTHREGRSEPNNLRDQLAVRMGLRMWPTPKGSPSGPDFARTNRPESGGDDLATSVARGGIPTRQTYPTPIGGGRTHDPGLNSSASSRRKMGGRAPQTHLLKSEKWYQQVMGQLNPEWVEWLMGWPIGWTALEPLATDRYRRWLRLHGGC